MPKHKKGENKKIEDIVKNLGSLLPLLDKHFMLHFNCCLANYHLIVILYYPFVNKINLPIISLYFISIFKPMFTNSDQFLQ